MEENPFRTDAPQPTKHIVVIRCDYYPLTPYSQHEDVWMAWQFNRPAAGQGMVQAFRRAAADRPVASVKLRGLEPDAQYKLTDLESNRTWQAGGRDLMDKGLAVLIPTKPGAGVIVYEIRDD